VLEKATAVETVTALTKEGYDLFFNLCDGAADEKRSAQNSEGIRTRTSGCLTGSCHVFGVDGHL